MSQILEGDLQQAEFQRVAWGVKPPAGTKLDDVLQPEYWTHAAKKLRVGAQIEVVPEDVEWFALLIVRANTKSGVKVSVLNYVPFSVEDKPKKPKAEKPEGNDDFEVKFAGADKWRVSRRSDGEIVAKGLASRQEALDWIERESEALV